MPHLRWPEDANRLDFELLRDSAVTLGRSREVLAEHAAWLRRHGYLVPAYYGRNLDAFNDCLCGVEVPEEGGMALAFLSFDVLHRLSPERAWHVLDIVARWSRFFLLTGRRLMALVQTDAPRFQVKPVGARPVLL